MTNVGAAAAGPSTLTVTWVGTFSIPALAAGQSVTMTWSVCRTAALTAVADRTKVVAEADESNNTRSITTHDPQLLAHPLTVPLPWATS